MDKLCIDQDDKERKEAGIRNLGAFLSHTSTLVVLWSSQYLERLWCVFELATWLHMHCRLPNKPLSAFRRAPPR